MNTFNQAHNQNYPQTLYRSTENLNPTVKEFFPKDGAFFSDNVFISKLIHPYGAIFSITLKPNAKVLEIDARNHSWKSLELSRNDFTPKSYYYHFKKIILQTHFPKIEISNKKFYLKINWLKDLATNFKDIDIIAVKNIKETDRFDVPLSTTYLILNSDIIAEIKLLTGDN